MKIICVIYSHCQWIGHTTFALPYCIGSLSQLAWAADVLIRHSTCLESMYHYGDQSRGCLMGGGPLWPPTVPQLAARSSQSNPRGSGPEVLKREHRARRFPLPDGPGQVKLPVGQVDLNRFFLFISYKQIEEFQNSWSRASDDFEKGQAL